MTSKYLALPAETLHEYFSYDEDTGYLFWKERPRHHFKTTKAMRISHTRTSGKRAGYVHNSCQKKFIDVGRRPYFSRLIHLNGYIYKEHRIIWALLYKEWPDFDIDHINGDSTDNRISNLRKADKVLNGKNLPLRSDNTSGTVGVHFSKVLDKWVARISDKGEDIYLGHFSNKDEAVLVRKEAEIKYGYSPYHGEGRDQMKEQMND
jgi:hypothetical protein